ncbi:MAG: YfhO family protein, partial [Pedosphaera parvula]|nr:YfhO family protein [Pedosphaera parvula]
DLGRANQPWIRYYNYKEKYASNPVIDILREKPYEQRVAIMPFFQIPQLQAFHAEVYHKLWLQHHFPYYHIQSLNDAQDPRPAQEKTNYVTQVSRNITRYWQLTNTRLLFGMNTVQTPKGPASFVDLLNGQLDPLQRRFRVHTAFDLVQPGPGRTITAQTNATGQFALIEFTGALPRTRLYSNWEVISDEKAALKRLADPQFDPEQTVLIGTTVPPPAQGITTNANPGTVDFARYSPKYIKLDVDTKVASVLLLNDRYQPDWKVWVNGQPAPLLRCNFIMRGVQVPPGKSVVEFRFQPPITTLYVSLAAVAFGLGLVGFAAFARKPEEPSAPAPKEQPAPAGKDKRKSK